MAQAASALRWPPLLEARLWPGMETYVESTIPRPEVNIQTGMAEVVLYDEAQQRPFAEEDSGRCGGRKGAARPA